MKFVYLLLFLLGITLLLTDGLLATVSPTRKVTIDDYIL